MSLVTLGSSSLLRRGMHRFLYNSMQCKPMTPFSLRSMRRFSNNTGNPEELTKKKLEALEEQIKILQKDNLKGKRWKYVAIASVASYGIYQYACDAVAGFLAHFCLVKKAYYRAKEQEEKAMLKNNK
ncbi:MAG: hypothetical protein WBQ73_03555 [Candidatus Babeliales bacterium]